MPLKYSNLTFDELIRTLRDDDNPTVRMLALRADLEVQELHADYMATIQDIEHALDRACDKRDEYKQAIKDLAERIA